MNCIIVHGCPDDYTDKTYNKHWIPWIKEQLSQKNIETLVPLMPQPWNPNYENFKKEFEKLKISEDSILIGWSCGCAFIVRWLGETNQKIKNLS
ncbi:MAG: alpha/beta hydrolase [Nanoarchaeota archaeon]|nr:alpha/beta hydrolase [Nanoarchaeota archaeon]